MVTRGGRGPRKLPSRRKDKNPVAGAGGPYGGKSNWVSGPRNRKARRKKGS